MKTQITYPLGIALGQVGGRALLIGGEHRRWDSEPKVLSRSVVQRRLHLSDDVAVE